MMMMAVMTVMFMVFVVLVVLMLIILIKRAFYPADPCRACCHPVEVEVAGVQKFLEIDITIIALDDHGCSARTTALISAASSGETSDILLRRITLQNSIC